MKTILVVDDQERIRRTYRRVFAKEGYRVLEAKNAVEANDIAKFSRVDLMLLDINMPEVDGSVLFDVTVPFKRGLKVIVSSVYPLDDQKQKIRGAADYFDKSEGINVLKAKVSRVLSEDRQEEKARAT